jgi:diaminopimelate epimerase
VINPEVSMSQSVPPAQAIAGRASGRVPFTKMNGSGNDFIVIDNRPALLAEREIAPFTRAVCRRGVALGADGVVLIEDPRPGDEPADFRWRYFNADGSEGELCGNGAMCGARFAVLNGIAPARCRFLTLDGPVDAEVVPADAGPGLVRIAIADPVPFRPPVTLTAAGRSLAFTSLRVGVPHAVAVVDDADAFVGAADFAQIGAAIRHDPHFTPDGANINIIHVIDGQTLRMRTYERGVEAETLACGTGAVASAVIATARGLARPPVTVITSSGRPLRVAFTPDGDSARTVTLAGEARIVATGELWPEAWV